MNETSPIAETPTVESVIFCGLPLLPTPQHRCSMMNANPRPLRRRRLNPPLIPDFGQYSDDELTGLIQAIHNERLRRAAGPFSLVRRRIG